MKEVRSSFLRESEVVEFLSAHPDYESTLQRAIRHEEIHMNNPEYLAMG